MPVTPLKSVEIATRHQVHLERVKSGYLKEFEVFLKQMDREIRLRLAGISLSEISNTQLELILRTIRITLGNIWKDYEGVYFAVMREVGEYEAAFEAKALNEVIKVDVTVPQPQQIRSAVLNHPLSVRGIGNGMLLEPFYAGWSERSILRVDGAIRLGYAQGLTTPQILQVVRGTRARKFKDGILNMVNKDAALLVRTGVQHVAVQAREETWRRNSDIVKEVEWISTLDDRTTQQCRSLDGRRFPFDKGPRPPIHIGCRSSVVAVLDKRFKVLQEDATRFSRGESGARPVSAKLTYYEWLKRQPTDFQDSAIGPVRGKLLREGGLSAERFAELNLGRNFEPLTLDEMRRLEPVAFNRAGI